MRNAVAASTAVGSSSAPWWQDRLVRLLLVGDVVVVVTAVIVAQVALGLRFGGTHALELALSAVLIPVWLLAVASAGGYELRFLGTGTEEFKRIGTATVTLTALVGFGAFVFMLPFSRIFVAMAVPGAGVLLLLERYVARVWLHSLRKQGRALHRVVAVGTAEEVEHLLAQVDRESSAGWSVVGVCLVGGPDLGLDDLPFLSRATTVEDVAKAADEVAADTIAVLHPRALGAGGIRRLAWQLEGTHTHLLLSPQLTDIAGPRVTIRPLIGLPLLHLEQPTFSDFKLVVKRTLDIVVGSLLTLVALPILAVAAIAIKIDSRGPVFYRQQRVGVGGEHFNCLKLRSMRVDADEQRVELAHLNDRAEGLLLKMRTDPRVTRVGRLLRRLSITCCPSCATSSPATCRWSVRAHRCGARWSATRATCTGGCWCGRA